MLSLSPLRERKDKYSRQDARTFVEFVRRTFGDAARPTWDCSSVKSSDIAYVQSLGTVLGLKEEPHALPPSREIPAVPELRGEVLVCVLGAQPMPAIVAALCGQPQTIVLLTTVPLVPVAGRVHHFLKARGLNVSVALIDEIKPKHFREYMQRICARLAPQQKLRLNISGGTKAMALNAFLGTDVTAERTVEYTQGHSIITLRPERLTPVRVPVTMSFKERLNLLGLGADEAQLRAHTFRKQRVFSEARRLVKARSGPGFDAALEGLRAAWTGNDLPASLMHDTELQARRDEKESGLRAYKSRWAGFSFELMVYAALVHALKANQPGGPRAAMGVEVQLLSWKGDAEAGQDVPRSGTYKREADVLLEVEGSIVLVEAKLSLMRGIGDAQEHLDAVELAQRLGGRYTHTAIVGLSLPKLQNMTEEDRARWESVLAGSSLEGTYSLHVIQAGNQSLPRGVWLWEGTSLEDSVNEMVKGMRT